jgi:hypothetical protein
VRVGSWNITPSQVPLATRHQHAWFCTQLPDMSSREPHPEKFFLQGYQGGDNRHFSLTGKNSNPVGQPTLGSVRSLDGLGWLCCQQEGGKPYIRMVIGLPDGLSLRNGAALSDGCLNGAIFNEPLVHCGRVRWTGRTYAGQISRLTLGPPGPMVQASHNNGHSPH